MDAFTELDAIASPEMRQNIDTDIVIPIHRLRDVAQAGADAATAMMLRRLMTATIPSSPQLLSLTA